MMWMRLEFVIISFFILLASSSVGILGDVRADGGFIPTARTDVSEPGQHAIIGFNGGAERMVLSVNVRSRNQTEGFHVIPFPSMPRISLGNISIFHNLTRIIKEDNYYSVFPPRRNHYNDGEGDNPASVVLYKEMGDHKVTVIKVSDYAGFRSQIREIASYLGLDVQEWPTKLGPVVQGYVQRGIRYFTIDEYSIPSENTTIDPLVFEFNTDRVYFPLEISSVLSGWGTITLDIIIPSTLPLSTDYRSGPYEFREFRYSITEKEMYDLDPSLKKILSGDARLIHLQDTVNLSMLKGDLEIGMENKIVSSCVLSSWQNRDVCLMESMEMIIVYNRADYDMKCLSLPSMKPVWDRKIGGKYLGCILRYIPAEDGGIVLALVHSGPSVRMHRIDPSTGIDIWTTDFSVYLGRSTDAILMDSPNGPCIAIMDSPPHLFELDGDPIPISWPSDEDFMYYSIIRHGSSDLIAYREVTTGDFRIFSPFPITYFDPSTNETVESPSGNIQVDLSSDLFWSIYDQQHITSERSSLDSVIATNSFIRECNCSYDTSIQRFFDPEMGMMELCNKSRILRCLDETTHELRWEIPVPYLYGQNYIYHAFMDVNEDEGKEMVLVGHWDYPWIDDYDCFSESSIIGAFYVIDGMGKIISQGSNFDAVLPIKKVDGKNAIAGIDPHGFCCYDLQDGIQLYRYKTGIWIDRLTSIVVSRWDAEGADVSFIYKEDYRYTAYRANSTMLSFNEVATMTGEYCILVDLGSTVGICLDCEMYTYQYEDLNVTRSYHTLWIPERNLGVDGLRSFLNGSETEVYSPLITPFIDPAPIAISILIIVLVINWRRRCMKG
jgi:hypothetical protein